MSGLRVRRLRRVSGDTLVLRPSIKDAALRFVILSTLALAMAYSHKDGGSFANLVRLVSLVFFLAGGYLFVVRYEFTSAHYTKKVVIPVERRPIGSDIRLESMGDTILFSSTVGSFIVGDEIARDKSALALLGDFYQAPVSAK